MSSGDIITEATSDAAAAAVEVAAAKSATSTALQPPTAIAGVIINLSSETPEWVSLLDTTLKSVKKDVTLLGRLIALCQYLGICAAAIERQKKLSLRDVFTALIRRQAPDDEDTRTSMWDIITEIVMAVDSEMKPTAKVNALFELGKFCKDNGMLEVGYAAQVVDSKGDEFDLTEFVGLLMSAIECNNVMVSKLANAMVKCAFNIHHFREELAKLNDREKFGEVSRRPLIDTETNAQAREGKADGEDEAEEAAKLERNMKPSQKIALLISEYEESSRHLASELFKLLANDKIFTAQVQKVIANLRKVEETARKAAAAAAAPPSKKSAGTKRKGTDTAVGVVVPATGADKTPKKSSLAASAKHNDVDRDDSSGSASGSNNNNNNDDGDEAGVSSSGQAKKQKTTEQTMSATELAAARAAAAETIATALESLTMTTASKPEQPAAGGVASTTN
jgi:hypothetical protein